MSAAWTPPWEWNVVSIRALIKVRGDADLSKSKITRQSRGPRRTDWRTPLVTPLFAVPDTEALTIVRGPDRRAARAAPQVRRQGRSRRGPPSLLAPREHACGGVLPQQYPSHGQVRVRGLLGGLRAVFEDYLEWFAGRPATDKRRSRTSLLVTWYRWRLEAENRADVTCGQYVERVASVAAQPTRCLRVRH